MEDAAMMKIAAFLVFACYALIGLFLLAVAPMSFGIPACTVSVIGGLWVSARMLRAQVQPI